MHETFFLILFVRINEMHDPNTLFSPISYLCAQNKIIIWMWNFCEPTKSILFFIILYSLKIIFEKKWTCKVWKWEVLLCLLFPCFALISFKLSKAILKYDQQFFSNLFWISDLHSYDNCIAISIFLFLYVKRTFV